MKNKSTVIPKKWSMLLNQGPLPQGSLKDCMKTWAKSIRACTSCDTEESCGLMEKEFPTGCLS